MLWLLLSLLTAFFESLKDAFGKRGAQQFPPHAIAAAMTTITGLVGTIAASYFDGPPALESGFWSAAIPSIAINCLVMLMYFRALKNAPLSVALPLLKLSPVFLLLSAPIITHERLPLAGMLGVLITVMGTWMVGVSTGARGVVAPFISLVKESGTRSMLIVAVLWSITAAFDKLAVQRSSPLWWVAIANSTIAVFLASVSGWRATFRLLVAQESRSRVLPIGLFASLALAAQMLAIPLAPVAYVISIKRASAFFGMIWGKLFFQEELKLELVTGAAFMLAGIFIIAVSG